MIIPKKQMTVEDIKLHYITPAILKGWSKNYITMETKITDGKINLRGNLVVRENPIFLSPILPMVMDLKNTII